MNMVRYILILLFLLSSCDKVREMINQESEGRQKGSMVKNAFRDFFTFAVDVPQDVEASENSGYNDVWKIADKSTKHRGRVLVWVDADLEIPEKLIRRKGFELANYILVDTKADCVKIQFWTRGFRKTGGVFAEIFLSNDGSTWEGSRKGRDKYFSYLPSGRKWKSLSKQQLAALRKYTSSLVKARKSGKKDSAAVALRDAAGATGISPVEIKKLLKKVERMFYHPKEETRGRR
ncbi:MAG: hypothetical protein JXR95_12510 [Deltaproteobacteria bacterium]|nr:hypothetical protein [Deltaproteobacteria bacterium]